MHRCGLKTKAFCPSIYSGSGGTYCVKLVLFFGELCQISTHYLERELYIFTFCVGNAEYYIYQQLCLSPELEKEWCFVRRRTMQRVVCQLYKW